MQIELRSHDTHGGELKGNGINEHASLHPRLSHETAVSSGINMLHVALSSSNRRYAARTIRAPETRLLTRPRRSSDSCLRDRFEGQMKSAYAIERRFGDPL